MARLSHRSKLRDVISCDEDLLRSDMSLLHPSVITEYVFYLRLQLEAKDLNIDSLKLQNDHFVSAFEELQTGYKEMRQTFVKLTKELAFFKLSGDFKFLQNEVKSHPVEVSSPETETQAPELPDAIPSRKSVIPGYDFPCVKISLQGPHKGYYISADESGDVGCNKKQALECEQFMIEKNTPGNRIYLKSCHGKYLSAGPTGTLECKSDRKTDWERFEVHMVDKQRVGLKSFHGKWVSALPNGSIAANIMTKTDWEYFVVHEY